MTEPGHPQQRTATVEQRVDAIQSVLEERGMKPAEFIEQANHLVEEQWLPHNGARVVAAFQNISATHLKKLDAVVDCDVLVCGDDEDAKRTGMQLVRDVGMRAWDAGPLDNSVVVEGLTPILLGINKRHKVKGAGIRITGA